MPQCVYHVLEHQYLSVTNNQGTPRAKTGKDGAMIQHRATPDAANSSGQKPAERFLLPGIPYRGGGAINRLDWTQARLPEQEEPDLLDHSALNN